MSDVGAAVVCLVELLPCRNSHSVSLFKADRLSVRVKGNRTASWTWWWWFVTRDVTQWVPIFWMDMTTGLNCVTLRRTVCWRSTGDRQRQMSCGRTWLTVCLPPTSPRRTVRKGCVACGGCIGVLKDHATLMNHTFEPLKLHVGGGRNHSNEEVEMAVRECLWMQERYISATEFWSLCHVTKILHRSWGVCVSVACRFSCVFV